MKIIIDLEQQQTIQMADSIESTMDAFRGLKEGLEQEGVSIEKKIDAVKHVAKHFYTLKLPDAKKYKKLTLDYYEVCVWGHIHNLDKEKAVKALHKYETLFRDEMDRIMFDHEDIRIIKREDRAQGIVKGNDETFRVMCESSQETLQQLKIMISLL